MNEEILCSIIIPVYNGEKYIDRALKSIFEKNNSKNYEVIIINDGSTDKTDMIIKSFLNIYTNLIYKKIENHGVSYARNLGIDTAKGKYILFLDVDDEYSYGLIDSFANYEKGFLADLYIINRKNIFKDFSTSILNHETNIKQYEKEDYILNKFSLAKESCFLVTNKIYKKSIIVQNNVKFPIDVKYSEDLIFNFIYLNNIKQIVEIPDIFYYRYYNSGSAIMKNIENYFELNVKNINMYVKCNKKIINNLYLHFAFISIDRLVKKIDYNNNLNRAKELKKIKKICQEKNIRLKYEVALNYRWYSKFIGLNEYIFLLFFQLIFSLKRKLKLKGEK